MFKLGLGRQILGMWKGGNFGPFFFENLPSKIMEVKKMGLYIPLIGEVISDSYLSNFSQSFSTFHDCWGKSLI